MDWRHYSDAEQRDNRKMYDDVSVDKWDTINGKLMPAGQTELIEKARYVSSDRGSNKYNITQTIAETFGLFCSYEYKCAANGQFIKNYVDENGRPMTGRTAVFYNRAVKTDKPFYMDYQKNLQSISRTCDTSEVYTKLFVDPIQSETMTDGYITIANTPANPLMDEFILNFDYLYSKGSITEYQKNFVDEYSAELHDKNTFLRDLGNYINLLTVELNDKKAEKAGAEKSISSLTEELTHYQTLRDNDVTNTPVIKDKNNSYSVVFVNVSDTEVPYYRAEIRLEGVLSGSINGYDTYEYKDLIFAASNLVSSNDYKPLAEGDTNMYVVLDEDGYAKGLYTGNADWFKTEEDENSYSLNASYIIYLALEYSPHNKYVEVCERFERMITKNRKRIAICETEIKRLETILDGQLEQQTNLLKEKDLLNQKFERIMGPALREGHWSAQDYEDIGRKTEVELAAKPLPNNIELGSEILTFDTKLFEDEEKGYYYASAEDASNDIHTYHDYINITDYINDWQNKNPEDLVLHFANPEFKYTVTESQYEGLAAGKYFIIYNMTKYYFELSEALNAGASLRLYVSPKAGPSLQQKVNETAEWDDIEWLEPPTSEEELYYSNLSNAFEGLNKYLGTYKIYPNAGFVYAFKYNEGELPTPILLLNSTEINYSIYKQIWYSFGMDEPAEIDLYPKKTSNGEFTICYPRIIITKDNVNYDDDLLSIKLANAEKALVKYEDYAVLLRNGHPYITLKVTDHTTPYALLNTPHTIIYRTSQANEMLYRDAIEVARENSRPRFSYDVQITQIPETVESYELGQLGYINDSALGVNAAKGYISQITLVLDNPKDDEIQIQNYKTKFEDLFSTITASSETIKSNQQSYDIAASIINPSTGGIQGSILQDSFNKNKVELTYSNTQVHIDDTDGITLTNSEPYSNGVYGQVVMRGGGIYLSNTVDNNYERVWSTGITPNGINASMITTGRLDANLVRILAGNNVAFQWNSEGIYAYKRDENNQFLPNTYVRYSDKGLQYIDNGNTMVDLGWGGLVVNSQDGSVSLTGKDGLVVYEGLPNQNKTNQVVKLGRFGEEGGYTYGLKLYKSENDNYVETLTTENNGQLWLKDYLTVGAEGAGISGVNDNSNPVRFWAGSNFTNRSVAPFRVLHDGSVYATKMIIGSESSLNGVAADALTDIINIDFDGRVTIADGKVTAGSIAAGAVTTGGIAAGSELYLYTAGENEVLADLPVWGTNWLNPETNAWIEITNSESYINAVNTTLNYNYNLSTGGKMKLSSGGVEIKATNSSKDLEGNDISVENGISIDKTAVIIGAKDLTNSSEGEEKYLSRLIINSDGIDATSASFNSITLNGKAIFGGAEVVVQSSEPTERRGPTVWIRPNWNVYADVSKTLTAVSTIAQKNNTKELLLDFIGPGISEESNIETIYELTITTNIIHQSGFSYIINADNKLVVEFYSDEDTTTPFISFKQNCPITEATKWKTTTYTLKGTSAYNIFRDEYINHPIVMKYYSEGGDTNNQFRLAEGYEIKLVGKLAATTEGSGRALCSIWYFDS